MIRPRLRTPRLGASFTPRTAFGVNSRRCLHNVPKLRHDYTETGVPNLMSPAGFSIAWSDYMTLVTEKLNALTAGLLRPFRVCWRCGCCVLCKGKSC